MWRAILGTIVGVLILGPVASATNRAVDDQGSRTAAQVSGVAQGAAPYRHRRHTCGPACKQLVIGQGDSPQGCVGAVLGDEKSTPNPSLTLTFGDEDPGSYPDLNAFPGDVFVAALVTAGDPVTPPLGWTEVPDSDHVVGAGTRLQVFYSIPVPLTASTYATEKYTFSSSMPQTMSGALAEFTGISQVDPIAASAGESDFTPSLRVVAPSLDPRAASTQLVFVGAANEPETWQLPANMRSLSGHKASPGPSIGYQSWLTPSPTGIRSATLSTPAAGIGDVIALAYPGPHMCPMVRLVNRPRQLPSDAVESSRRGIVLAANAKGQIAVRLKCEWTARCVGAFGLSVSPPPMNAAGGFSIPANQTRTVHLGLCRPASRCPPGTRPLPPPRKHALN